MTARGLRIGLASATKLVLLAVSLGVTTALRFVRLFPNNDPIMAVMLPCAKRGRVAALVFPVAAMVLLTSCRSESGSGPSSRRRPTASSGSGSRTRTPP